jgi:hypothetical protein
LATALLATGIVLVILLNTNFFAFGIGLMIVSGVGLYHAYQDRKAASRLYHAALEAISPLLS